MIRLQIRINESDFKILLGLAAAEYREPRGQAAILIRESLEHRGLIKITRAEKNQSEQPREECVESR
jgi:hypothetical protein